MAFWNSWVNDFTSMVAERVAAGVINRQAVQPILEARAYRQGFYKPQLRVRGGQFDDNVGLPFTGLVASRIVGQMIGRGVELDFEGDTETENEQYVKAVLKANKEEILFHRAILGATESGTGYLLVIPDGIVGEDGQLYPRLQIINPAYVKMDALPEDYEVVIRYTIEYVFVDDKEKEQGRRKVIEHSAPETLTDGTLTGGNTWTVKDYEQSGYNKWTLVNTSVWPYEFPPILHWQSLPSVADCYGEADINSSMIELQDRINFTASNNSKIIRLYAHPFRIGRGVTNDNMKIYDSGPDKMLLIPSGPDVGVEQLDALGDLTAADAHLKMLRQAFFDVARTVDIDSIGDKLGALTNFALRVLYQDNLTMIATKRELFGDMLEELSRRLQILKGMAPQPCKCVWPEFLPESEVEEQAALQGDLNMGLVSKQTASAARGYDWEEESARISEEKDAESNIGEGLLRAFSRGEGGFNANPAPVNEGNNLA